MKEKEKSLKDAETLRITRYFRKIMKQIAKDVLAKKMVTLEDLQTMYENSCLENILVRPVYIKYKFTERQLPKVTIRSEFTSMKKPLRIAYKGSFLIKKPTHKHNQKKLFVTNYKVWECKLK